MFARFVNCPIQEVASRLSCYVMRQTMSFGSIVLILRVGPRTIDYRQAKVVLYLASSLFLQGLYLIIGFSPMPIFPTCLILRFLLGFPRQDCFVLIMPMLIFSSYRYLPASVPRQKRWRRVKILMLLIDLSLRGIARICCS